MRGDPRSRRRAQIARRVACARGRSYPPCLPSAAHPSLASPPASLNPPGRPVELVARLLAMLSPTSFHSPDVAPDLGILSPRSLNSNRKRWTNTPGSLQKGQGAAEGALAPTRGAASSGASADEPKVASSLLELTRALELQRQGLSTLLQLQSRPSVSPSGGTVQPSTQALADVIEEIVSTEANYAADLRFVASAFCQPLAGLLASPCGRQHRTRVCCRSARDRSPPRGWRGAAGATWPSLPTCRPCCSCTSSSIARSPRCHPQRGPPAPSRAATRCAAPSWQ